MAKPKKRVHKKILTFYRERPRRWIKGNYSDGAGGYCLLGAMEKIYYPNGSYSFSASGVRKKLVKAIESLFPCQGNPLTGFNDHYKTTFKDVMKVLRKANV